MPTFIFGDLCVHECEYLLCTIHISIHVHVFLWISLCNRCTFMLTFAGLSTFVYQEHIHMGISASVTSSEYQAQVCAGTCVCECVCEHPMCACTCACLDTFVCKAHICVYMFRCQHFSVLGTHLCPQVCLYEYLCLPNRFTLLTAASQHHSQCDAIIRHNFR